MHIVASLGGGRDLIANFEILLFSLGIESMSEMH